MVTAYLAFETVVLAVAVPALVEQTVPPNDAHMPTAATGAPSRLARSEPRAASHAPTGSRSARAAPAATAARSAAVLSLTALPRTTPTSTTTAATASSIVVTKAVTTAITPSPRAAAARIRPIVTSPPGPSPGTSIVTGNAAPMISMRSLRRIATWTRMPVPAAPSTY
jgi:hypothetical protein